MATRVIPDLYYENGQLTAFAGAAIKDCVIYGIELAKQHDAPVMFKFNRVYVGMDKDSSAALIVRQYTAACKVMEGY